MRASRQHRTRPQTPASRQLAQRLKIFSDCNKERLNDDAFGSSTGYATGCEAFAKGTEKSNNFVGELSGWRASHRSAAALASLRFLALAETVRLCSALRVLVPA
jgi:hypothetical protein